MSAGRSSRSKAFRTTQPLYLSHILLFACRRPGRVGASTRTCSACGFRTARRSVIAFLHTPHGSDHHLIAFAKSDGVGLHHSSWCVPSIDAVGMGTQQMIRGRLPARLGHRATRAGLELLPLRARSRGAATPSTRSTSTSSKPAALGPTADHPGEDSLYVWGPARALRTFIVNKELASLLSAAGQGRPPDEQRQDIPLYDVVQIGYGPVSEILALALARQGHQRVPCSNAGRERYPLPRAVCIDHELFRVLSALGMGRHELPSVSHAGPAVPLVQRRVEGTAGSIDWKSAESISGGPEVHFIHQPTLETMFDDGGSRPARTVELNLGWEAIEIDTDAPTTSQVEGAPLRRRGRAPHRAREIPGRRGRRQQHRARRRSARPRKTGALKPTGWSSTCCPTRV